MSNNKLLYASDILMFSIDSRKNKDVRKLPEKHFSILLVKRKKDPYKGMWCLPGGFVKEDETSYDAASRILKKETNLENFYVEQLRVYDKNNRDPRGKVVSVAYMALVDKSKIKQELSSDSKWFDIKIEENNNKIKIILINGEKIKFEISKKLINKQSNQYKYELLNSNNIAFDHSLIINDGIYMLRQKANNSDIIFNLMPEKFTIGELKQVYEIILGKKLINSAFRRVIASKIKPIKETIKTGGHRPSQKFEYKNF